MQGMVGKWYKTKILHIIVPLFRNIFTVYAGEGELLRCNDVDPEIK